jgi:hypothetical protein
MFGSPFTIGMPQSIAGTDAGIPRPSNAGKASLRPRPGRDGALAPAAGARAEVDVHAPADGGAEAVGRAGRLGRLRGRARGEESDAQQGSGRESESRIAHELASAHEYSRDSRPAVGGQTG